MQSGCKSYDTNYLLQHLGSFFTFQVQLFRWVDIRGVVVQKDDESSMWFKDVGACKTKMALLYWFMILGPIMWVEIEAFEDENNKI